MRDDDAENAGDKQLLGEVTPLGEDLLGEVVSPDEALSRGEAPSREEGSHGGDNNPSCLSYPGIESNAGLGVREDNVSSCGSRLSTGGLGSRSGVSREHTTRGLGVSEEGWEEDWDEAWEDVLESKGRVVAGQYVCG